MAEPRKKKKRKTGRPLEDVPLRKLLNNVRRDIEQKMKLSFSGGESRKEKKD
jgi:hypothetical protein